MYTSTAIVCLWEYWFVPTLPLIFSAFPYDRNNYASCLVHCFVVRKAQIQWKIDGLVGRRHMLSSYSIQSGVPCNTAGYKHEHQSLWKSLLKPLQQFYNSNMLHQKIKHWHFILLVKLPSLGCCKHPLLRTDKLYVFGLFIGIMCSLLHLPFSFVNALN